jgi:dipicolinate synthase subunit A
MLTGIEVAVIGGDARHLEVIRRLADMDAGVTLFGYDNWQNGFGGVKRGKLQPEALATMDALILPIAGMDDSGAIESIFSSEPLVLEEAHFSRLKPEARVYTGFAKSRLKELCGRYGIHLEELLERDDVAIYNSIPSAEGALMLAIQHTDITIHSSQCMVLGFGRTGMTLARVLQGLGAKVKVGVRRSEHYARAVEMGFQPFYTKQLSREIGDVDMLFNTVPELIVTAKVISEMKHSAIIIDLASKPGGTDFRYAEKRGIHAILAPGLPGIVAPKTAGKILAMCLEQLLGEQITDRGN